MTEDVPPQHPGLLAAIGPGILVAATGVGAGDLATAAFTGGQLGVAVLWAVLLGAALKFALNEGLARWQLASGSTLLEGAVAHLGRAVAWVFLPYLLLWSFFVGSALMSACGACATAIVPCFEPGTGKVVFGILHSLVGVVLVLLGGFTLFERVMSVCIGAMFVIVLVTAGCLWPGTGEVLRGLLVPDPALLQGPSLGWTVALMGGVGGTLTVLSYGYWIREAGREGLGALRLCRIDLGVGYAMTALFGVAMVVIGAATPVEGKGAGLILALATQLEATLGPAGKWAFLLGAWGAVFSSLLGVWQSVPYLFADFMLQARRAEAPGEGAPEPAKVDVRSLPYRGYLLGLATVPMLGLMVDFKQVQKLYAIVGACFIPLLAGVLLLLTTRRAWVGEAGRTRPLGLCVLVAALAFFLALGVQGALG
ncbi:MAG: Nramp family divalent metal transporter [Planctomycetes bacterium]|nr:Nramp family divalent metal transporter [Planctomycetota bacterium]